MLVGFLSIGDEAQTVTSSAGSLVESIVVGTLVSAARTANDAANEMAAR